MKQALFGIGADAPIAPLSDRLDPSMIRFKTMPNDRPEDSSAAKPAKTSKTRSKTAEAAQKQDLLDLPADEEDEKD